MEAIGMPTQSCSTILTDPQIGQAGNQMLKDGDKDTLNANSIKRFPTDYSAGNPEAGLAQAGDSNLSGSIGQQIQKMFNDLIQEFVNLLMSIIQALSNPNGPTAPAVKAPTGEKSSIGPGARRYCQ